MHKESADQHVQRAMELLWGERSEPRRGPKPSLDAEQIARAAIVVADAEGLDAVSMQLVAQTCGVTTMALYRYVTSKADLIALMLDIGLGAPPRLDDIPGGWRPQLESLAAQLLAIFQQHPWSLAATAPVRPMGPNELGWFEVAIHALSKTNLTAHESVQSVLTILLHIRGLAPYVAIEHQQAIAGGTWNTSMATLLQGHDDNFPALRAAQTAGAFDVRESGSPDYGLQVILDGISARIAERGGA